MNKVTQNELQVATDALSAALDAYGERSPRDDVEKHTAPILAASYALLKLRRREIRMTVDHGLLCRGTKLRRQATDILAEEAAIETAGKRLGFTLREQGSDDLDFHDVGINRLADALRAVFRAGQDSREAAP
jgi:hypothetical protein